MANSAVLQSYQKYENAYYLYWERTVSYENRSFFKFQSFRYSVLQDTFQKFLKFCCFWAYIFSPLFRYMHIIHNYSFQEDSEQCFQDILLITLYFTFSENPQEGPHHGSIPYLPCSQDKIHISRDGRSTVWWVISCYKYCM